MENPKKLISGFLESQNLTSGRMILFKLKTVFALIALLVFFSIFGNYFFTMFNLINVVKHSALIAFLGIGMTLVIISGGIDLSVGSIVNLTGILAAGLLFEGFILPIPFFDIQLNIFFNPVIIICIGLLIGTFVGYINGTVITRLGVAPFIATLGMLYVARGFAKLRTNGGKFSLLEDTLSKLKYPMGEEGFLALGGNFLGIPISIWLVLLIILIAIYITKKTPLGRHIYAVGDNEKAAKLSGVNVKRVRTFVYMFAGLCSAIVGLIWTAQLETGTPALGGGFELDAIAAAVLGGTSLAGGRGTIGGTIIGALVIGVLADGMTNVNVNPFWQDVIKGAVIVVAVVIDQLQSKAQQKTVLVKAKA